MLFWRLIVISSSPFLLVRQSIQNLCVRFREHVPDYSVWCLFLPHWISPTFPMILYDSADIILIPNLFLKSFKKFCIHCVKEVIFIVLFELTFCWLHLLLNQLVVWLVNYSSDIPYSSSLSYSVVIFWNWRVTDSLVSPCNAMTLPPYSF